MNAMPGTLEILKNTEEWQEWMDQLVLDRRIMGVTGPSNTGKSFLFEALKENLNSRRQDMPKDAPSIYVGHHNFSLPESLIDDRGYNRSMAFVLKSIAFQVAWQSTTYARELETLLQRHENVHTIESIEKLWLILGLYTFSAPKDSTLYVLLDNIDQEDDNVVKVFLEKFLDCKRLGRSDPAPNFRVRIFLTATTLPNINRSIPELRMQNLNAGLIDAYITSELKRLHIFQDPDKRSVTRRLLVQKELFEGSDGRFNIVGQKLEMLRKAIHEDQPEEELSKIIQATIEPDEAQQSQQVLKNLEASLQPQHIAHLNTLLMWAAYCQRRHYNFSFNELETALYLSNGMHTLEPLTKKIRERFGEVFVIDGLQVQVRGPILEILKRDEKSSDRLPSAGSPLFSLSISLQNAMEKDIRRFVWDLNEQMVSGKFEFSKPHDLRRTYRIKVNKLEAHLHITKSCLKLLNEKPQDTTQALLEYARDFLPKHLTELRGLCNQLSATDRASISQGLIQYLSDPFYLEYEYDSSGYGEFWLQCSDDMDSIRFWLDDPTTTACLQPRDVRWVKRAKESNNNAWFLSIASRLDSIDPHISSGSSEIADTEDEDSTTALESIRQGKLQWSQRFAAWIQAQLNDYSDVRRSMLIGAILFYDSMKPQAAEYFGKCLANADHKRNALMGIGRCKQSLRDREAYYSTFEELITAMRTDGNLEGASRDDVTVYMEIPKELAVGYTRNGRYDQAKRLCEDALEEFGSNIDLRWMFVISLCYAGRKEQLLVLFQDWTRDPSRYGGKSPPQSFFEWTEEGDNFSEFYRLLERIQDDMLLSSFAKVVEDAAEIANAQQSPSHSALLYAQGLANILSHDDKLQEAISPWERLVQSPQLPDPVLPSKWGWYHEKASWYLIQCKFDALCEVAPTEVDALPPDAGRTPADVERRVTELKSYIKFVQKNLIQKPTPSNKEKKYIANTYVMLGRQDLARKHTRQDMADYLEIMSDDDPDNDLPAIRGMFEIFCMTNDVHNAMSAFFLLDHSEGNRGFFPMNERCSLCYTGFEVDRPERWICKFCLYTACPDCYRVRVVEGTFKKPNYFCRPNHEFIGLRRGDCTEEEKVPGKIRIEFEIATDENGHSTRLGGRVVDIKDWLEQVRVKWELPPPSSTTKAQK